MMETKPSALSDDDENDLSLVAAIAASKQPVTPVKKDDPAIVESSDVVNSIVCQDCQKMLRTDQDCRSHAARTGDIWLKFVTIRSLEIVYHCHGYIFLLPSLPFV